MSENNKFKRKGPFVIAKIDRMVDYEGSHIKATASVTVAGAIAIHGIRVMQSAEKGLYVLMPSSSYTDRKGNNKYTDICHPVTAKAREAINEKVLEAYNQKLGLTKSDQTVSEETPKMNMFQGM